MKLYDLHIHSNYSDGLCSIEEIIKLTRNSQLKGIAITDHDTLLGIGKALILGEKYGIDVIPGIEFTITNKYHILGIFLDHKNNELCNELEIYRMKKAHWLLQLLHILKKRYPITEKEIVKTYGTLNMGTVATALYDKQIILKSRKEIWSSFFTGVDELNNTIPCMSAQKAIHLIHNAGGLAFLAHPGLIKEYGLENEIKKLIRYGLDGVEIYHISNYMENVVELLIEIAHKYDLLVSGGSDFHGDKNKKTYIGQYGLNDISMLRSKERRCILGN